MTFSITQEGKPLDPNKYNWDERTRVFSTTQSNLILDFSGYSEITFKVGNFCNFKSGSYCRFIAGTHCNFTTSFGCKFETGYRCNFNTKGSCIFYSASECNFITGSNCVFDATSNCSFKTGDGCTFTVNESCTFKVGENCVIVRRDPFEVICPIKGKLIKLNEEDTHGYLTEEDLLIKEIIE